MRLSDEQFEIIMSNPNIKFEYADIDQKVAYIPPKGDVIYINVDLSECPDDVLMAILYALASLCESKKSPWSQLDSDKKGSTFLEDCFVVNRYMKNLYPFVLLDEEVPFTHMDPKSITRGLLKEAYSNTLIKFVNLSRVYGCPFVPPSHLLQGEEIATFGGVDLNQVMSESSLNSDDNHSQSNNGEDDGGSDNKGNNKVSNGKSQGFSDSPSYSFLSVKQKRLSECLRAFFSRILDRGKRFKIDSLKLYNRRCRQSDLMYSSISKKVMKSQERLGILVDVSGSMDLDTISTLINLLRDDLLSVFSSDSLVLCWDTQEVDRYLVSELPSRLRHGGGTRLAGGVDTLVSEGCKTIVVYSDFEDDMSLSKACLEAKSSESKVFFCNPDSLDPKHRDNAVSLTENFLSLWNDTLAKASIF